MITHWDKKKDGILTESGMRKKLETGGYVAIFKYEYAPGTVFPDHTHSIEKIDAIVSGKFKVSMDGQEFILNPGDSIVIPKNTVHRAEVIGDKPVVSLDACKY